MGFDGRPKEGRVSLWELEQKCQKNYEEAISYYNKALRLNPYDIDCLVGKGETLKKLEQEEEANKCFGKAIKSDNQQNSDSYKRKADALRYLTKYEEAIIFYNKSLELNSYNIDSLEGKANVLYLLHRFEEANKCYYIILELTKNYSDFFQKMYNEKRNETIVYCIEKILESDPNNLICLGWGQSALMELERYGDAISYIDKILELDSDRIVDNLIDKTGALIKLGRYEEVISCCNKILELEKYYKHMIYKTLLFKAEALGELERYKEAIVCCDEILKSSNYKDYHQKAFNEKKRLKKLKGWWTW